MSDQRLTNEPSLRTLIGSIVRILGPESDFYSLAIIYGVGISLFSLATPISVQMLINTVANTGLTLSLVVLSVTLFVLLLLSGLLNALRIHVMELFQRRFYARMVSEIALRSIYALNPFFQDQRMGALFNRYFDIVIVQKNLPNLLIGGFTIVLQAAVGFVLVSLYHPLLLVFNLVLVALIWIIWLAWGKRAMFSAVQVSHRKHAVASWLEGLGESNGFFKSERHIVEALNRTDEVTGEYIKQHARHFRHHFAQTLSFLVLYALASAVLLGLGGWLVIQGQLSLGQLVAAELVLSVALLGVSQLGTYLAYFYEICGAIDELSLFYGIRQEEPTGGIVALGASADLQFANVSVGERGETLLDLELPGGTRVMGVVESHGLQRDFVNLLKRHTKPNSGYISLGGVDVMSVQPHILRQQIIYLARPTTVDLTIREYLALSGDNDSNQRDLAVLETVGLTSAIARLEHGLDTRLSTTGWPLTISETMQLKLAAAIIAEPRVLVLNQLYDVMPEAVLRRALDMLQAKCGCTVLYFTDCYRDLGFDTYFYLGSTQQRVFDSVEALCRETDFEVREEGTARLGRATPALAAS
ncbi:MAG: ABC transporter ATP-binding protein/permease [Gammaproteobacteria bacterium]|nr:ABC transporter ATP-binding protein/permease [Gammaproteobacteria bacterium]